MENIKRIFVFAAIATCMLAGSNPEANCAAQPIAPYTTMRDRGSFITQPFGHIYSFECPTYTDENPTLRQAKENTNRVLTQMRVLISQRFPQYTENQPELLDFLRKNRKAVAKQLNIPKIYLSVFISRLATHLHITHMATTDMADNLCLCLINKFLGDIYTQLCQLDFCIEKMDQVYKNGFGNIVGITNLRTEPEKGAQANPYRYVIQSDLAIAILLQAEIPTMRHKLYAQFQQYLNHPSEEIRALSHFCTRFTCVRMIEVINQITTINKPILKTIQGRLNDFPVHMNNQCKTIFTEDVRTYMSKTLELASKSRNAFSTLCKNHSLSTIFDICMSFCGHSMPELTHIFMLLEEYMYRTALNPEEPFASEDEKAAKTFALTHNALLALKPCLSNSIHALKDTLEPYKAFYHAQGNKLPIRKVADLEPFTLNNFDIEIEREAQKKQTYQQTREAAEAAASASWQQDILHMIEKHKRQFPAQAPAQRTKKRRQRGKRTNAPEEAPAPKSAPSTAPPKAPEPELQAVPHVAPYMYDERIIAWFKNPPKTPTSRVLYHTRPLIIDAYAQAYGMPKIWLNKRNPKQQDTQYLLPGYIENEQGKQFAVFACTLTRDKRRCYHRHCKIYQNLSALHDELRASGSWNIDGGMHTQKPTYKCCELNKNEHGTILEETDRTVKIQDHRNGDIITLLKSCFDAEIKE